MDFDATFNNFWHIDNRPFDGLFDVSAPKTDSPVFHQNVGVGCLERFIFPYWFVYFNNTHLRLCQVMTNRSPLLVQTTRIVFATSPSRMIRCACDLDANGVLQTPLIFHPRWYV